MQNKTSKYTHRLRFVGILRTHTHLGFSSEVLRKKSFLHLAYCLDSTRFVVPVLLLQWELSSMLSLYAWAAWSLSCSIFSLIGHVLRSVNWLVGWVRFLDCWLVDLLIGRLVCRFMG